MHVTKRARLYDYRGVACVSVTLLKEGRRWGLEEVPIIDI